MARQLRTHIGNVALFFNEWLQSPLQIGAVAPSSKKLCNAMARWLPADPDEFVIELGPGTGAVTHAMLNRGLRPDRLIAIEMSPKLTAILRKRFPRIHVINGDACHLDQLLAQHVPEAKHVGAVISSLPLRNFPPDVAETLALKIKSILRPEGKWVQYSYQIRNKRHQGDNHFQHLPSKIIWLNIPPARVSVFQK